jgi:hypothetical protein
MSVQVERRLHTTMRVYPIRTPDGAASDSLPVQASDQSPRGSRNDDRRHEANRKTDERTVSYFPSSERLKANAAGGAMVLRARLTGRVDYLGWLPNTIGLKYLIDVIILCTL